MDQLFAVGRYFFCMTSVVWHLGVTLLVFPHAIWTMAFIDHPLQARRSRRSLALSRSFNLDPFNEKAEDAINFMDQHSGVKLIMFAKMHEIARKNLLGAKFLIMQNRFPQDFNIHPVTFSLPGQKTALQLAMMKDPQGLWIVKPPNSNNGTGVRLITAMDPIPTGKTCVQAYIRDPFLIRNCKVRFQVGSIPPGPIELALNFGDYFCHFQLN